LNNAVDLLQALIVNRCVNDGSPDSGHEYRSVETLSEFFGEPGQVFEPHPGRQSVLYRIPGSDPSAERLMLMGHLDVVPVSPTGWTHDPFGGEIDDGFVWGRGAVDMLNVTAAMAMVFRQRMSGPQPDGDLLFLAVADEENGGAYGAEYLVDNHWETVRSEHMLTEIAYPAVAGAAGPIPAINVGEKGPFWHRLRSAGTPGHGSQPYGADNALIPLARAVTSVAASPTPVIITDDWRSFVATLGLHDSQKAGLVDPDLLDETIDAIAATDPFFARYVHACTHLTMTPTVFNAGGKANVIPDEAVASIDARLLPGQDEDTVREHLAKILGADAESITVELVRTSPANSSLPTGRLWESLLDAYELNLGDRQAAPTLTPASTDARFWRRRGAVAYGAGLFCDRVSFPEFLTMFHGHDERISLESMDLTVKFLGEAVAAFERRSP
jgi:acetylornithine deacetylase/succinyl-diaminopimelate desuccinylase-like protein